MALVAKGIDYAIKDQLVGKGANPHGKLPYLVFDEQGYEDSTHIIRMLDERSQHGPRLIPDDPTLASEANIFDDWADESLYWHGFWAKFVDQEGWDRLKPAIAEHLPAKALGIVVLPIVRRDLRSKIDAQGMTRRSPQRVREEFDRHLDSLEVRLSGRDYLVGSALSIADLSVASMIGQLTVGFTPSFDERIRSRSRLSDFLGRVLEQTVPPLPG